MKLKIFALTLTLALSFFVLSFDYLQARNLDNTPYDWYFIPGKNNSPSTTEPHYQKLLDKYGGYYIGNIQEKELYLTFDNGYENGYTPIILDILKEKGVPAAFFVTGHYLKTQPELVKRMVNEGHIVGNHSWNHPSLVDVDDQTLKMELEKVKEKFAEITGIEEMKYLRPPRGIFSERTLALSSQLGYTNIFWSLAYMDWDINNQKGSQFAYDSIMKRVHPGAIMLLHSVSKDNAEALGRVIDDLQKQGYTFKSLDELKK
ncbi:peptidoglycan-N-acetylmuramic acid deacetylase [Anaerobranca californiensis DSM 14826]|uniref:Peptidoglycan-N-acetylmuramic acid deacetylase n=1 Tax=Anaerobranca californiensis DSM 14826 TaxID=1120989 RepID=A0A1M6QDT8_9FIRM|nr:delta-lactam-biosynthetic de-N-acetylase [Anaerobranca californiensis]SHK18361.1 peptidoglycan-N-acetylmuramic acid deacetylase [Anaerobranca californiensis DSM 14826]